MFWTHSCWYNTGQQKYSKLRCLLRVKGLVIAFYLGCSGYATGCFVAFLGDISLLKAGWNLKKSFCFPALELFHCLPLWKTALFVSSRAFLLSTPTFLLSTSVEISEATWKKATKCNKRPFLVFSYLLCLLIVSRHVFNCVTYLLKVYRHVGIYNN